MMIWNCSSILLPNRYATQQTIQIRQNQQFFYQMTILLPNPFLNSSTKAKSKPIIAKSCTESEPILANDNSSTKRRFCYQTIQTYSWILLPNDNDSSTKWEPILVESCTESTTDVAAAIRMAESIWKKWWASRWKPCWSWMIKVMDGLFSSVFISILYIVFRWCVTFLLDAVKVVFYTLTW